MKPHITSQDTGGTVDAGHIVKLICRTPGARILYTTDGTEPEPQRLDIDVRQIMNIEI